MIESQRTNATFSIKKGFRSKCISHDMRLPSIAPHILLVVPHLVAMLDLTGNDEVAEMPVTPETLHSRFNADEYPVYKDVVAFFVSGVVGICHFDKNKTRHNYSISSIDPVQ